MHNTFVLVSCVKSKRNTSCMARDMYVSPLFRGMLRYAQSLNPDQTFILSAEYGLLNLDEVIAPYEKTLKKMKAAERQAWAGRVLAALAKEADLQKDRIIFLAGSAYRQDLTPHIKHYEIPMLGLPFGKQLQWLAQKVPA